MKFVQAHRDRGLEIGNTGGVRLTDQTKLLFKVEASQSSGEKL
ncbi:hypothetical protein X733_29465 [Mesorhizobium sp. L2C067A000]|nr:hypothetical protein X733_29465 [Mesorhizobium sp. L2C067A000]